MKTKHFNPSLIETKFIDAFSQMKDQLQERVDQKIVAIKKVEADNPFLLVTLEDKDGDIHELVIKFIQRYEP